MSEGPRLTLLKFPKQEPKATEPKLEMSPYEDVLDQAYEIRDQIKNIVIFADLGGGNLKVFNALDPNVDLWSFIDAIRLRSAQATNDYLNTGSAGQELTPA
jgi:hypothetical protein